MRGRIVEIRHANDRWAREASKLTRECIFRHDLRKLWRFWIIIRKVFYFEIYRLRHKLSFWHTLKVYQTCFKNIIFISFLPFIYLLTLYNLCNIFDKIYIIFSMTLFAHVMPFFFDKWNLMNANSCNLIELRHLRLIYFWCDASKSCKLIIFSCK